MYLFQSQQGCRLSRMYAHARAQRTAKIEKGEEEEAAAPAKSS